MWYFIQQYIFPILFEIIYFLNFISLTSPFNYILEYLWWLGLLLCIRGTGYIWWSALCQWCWKRCCLGRSDYHASKAYQYCPPFSHGTLDTCIIIFCCMWSWLLWIMLMISFPIRNCFRFNLRLFFLHFSLHQYWNIVPQRVHGIQITGQEYKNN